MSSDALLPLSTPVLIEHIGHLSLRTKFARPPLSDKTTVVIEGNMSPKLAAPADALRQASVLVLVPVEEDFLYRRVRLAVGQKQAGEVRALKAHITIPGQCELVLMGSPSGEDLTVEPLNRTNRTSTSHWWIIPAEDVAGPGQYTTGAFFVQNVGCNMMLTSSAEVSGGLINNKEVTPTLQSLNAAENDGLDLWLFSAIPNLSLPSSSLRSISSAPSLPFSGMFGEAKSVRGNVQPIYPGLNATTSDSSPPITQRVITVGASPPSHVVLARDAASEKIRPKSFWGMALDAERNDCFIVAVHADGPAWRSGLRPGDRMTYIDYEQVTNNDDAYRAMKKSIVGRPIYIQVERPYEEASSVFLVPFTTEPGNSFYFDPNVHQLVELETGGMSSSSSPAHSVDRLGPSLQPSNAPPPFWGALWDTDGEIRSIWRESPAWFSGLRPGDHIVAVNGIEVQDYQHLMRLYANSHVGEKISIKTKNGVIHHLVPKTTLEAFRSTNLFFDVNQSEKVVGFVTIGPHETMDEKNSVKPFWGLVVGGGRLAQANIVQSVWRDSPAWTTGIRPGHKITHIDGDEVNGWEDIISSMQNSLTGQPITITTTEGGTRHLTPQTIDDQRHPYFFDKKRSQLVEYSTDGQTHITHQGQQSDSPLDVAQTKPFWGLEMTEDFVVTGITNEGPAWKSGLRVGDRLVSVDGHGTTNSGIDNILKMMRNSHVGKPIDIVAAEGSHGHSTKRRLLQLTPMTTSNKYKGHEFYFDPLLTSNDSPLLSLNNASPFWGIGVAENDLTVTRIWEDGPAWRSGIRQHDKITHIREHDHAEFTAIKDLQLLEQFIQKSQVGRAVEVKTTSASRHQPQLHIIVPMTLDDRFRTTAYYFKEKLIY